MIPTFGNDTLSAPASGDIELFGDVEVVDRFGTPPISEIGTGSDFLVSGSSGNQTLIGDVVEVIDANVSGGDDRIDARRLTSGVSTHYGDVVSASSSLGDPSLSAGGDRMYGSATLSDVLIGDLGSLSNGSLFGGRDLIYGNGGNDTIVGDLDSGFAGSSATPFVAIDAGSDTLFGGAGNDRIFGDVRNIADIAGIFSSSFQGRADTIYGGDGNDYIVGDVEGVDDTVSVTAAGDVIRGQGGNDLIYGDVRFELLDPSLYTGGNDTVYGGTGNDTISGSAGNDFIFGDQDNDFLLGGEGNDRLDGGTGNDALVGGNGNDTYVVNSSADTILETSGSGGTADRVNTFVGYTLAFGSQIEILSTANVTGTGAIHLTGNGFAQQVIGNAGNNRLDGAGGNDTLTGSSGNDTLDGGLGADTLIGGAGNDTFLLNDTLLITNTDVVTDFNVANDIFHLENAIFTAITGTGTLTSNQFRLGNAAADADDRIMYNSATGNVIYDADGNLAGGILIIAIVPNGLALTNEDFFIV